MSTPWLRVRFIANSDDYRPVKWPPPGPYWCSGYGDDYSVVIAYVRSARQVSEYWPEANQLEVERAGKIEFTERFPKPEWWEDSDA